MKYKLLLLSFILLILYPVSAFGQNNKHYFSLKPGLFFFLGDLKDKHHMGFYCEIVYGYKLNKNFALELGTGWFHDGASGKPYGNEAKGEPVTFTVKCMFPIKNFKPFVGGGVNIFFVKYEGKLKGVHVHDKDNILGGHFLIGAEYNIIPTIFIGIEGKYIFTEKADFDGVKVNLNGIASIMRLGLRF